MKRTTVGLIAGLTLGTPALAQETPTPVDGEERPVTPPPQPPSTPGQAPRNSPISPPDSEDPETQEAPTEGTGGSGQQPAPEPDTEGQQGETKELTARVLGASQGILYVEGKEGAAIPLRVTHATRIEGKRVPREQAIGTFLRKELAPGKSVRVTFDVRTHEDGKLENVASTLDTP